MTDQLEAVREHLAAALALLDGPAPEAAGLPSGFDAGARAGVQIDPSTFAELVTMAERLGMAPALVLKLALRALEVELRRPMREKATRLVGAARGLLEGKR